MGGVVVFDYAKFILRYPEFSAVSPDRLQLFFDDATDIVDNSPNSRIRDIAVRERILFCLTAHIAALEGANVDGSITISGGIQMSARGRLASATQGSTSVSFDNAPLKTSSQAWYETTKYGQTAWLLMKPWRKFSYIR